MLRPPRSMVALVGILTVCMELGGSAKAAEGATANIVFVGDSTATLLRKRLEASLLAPEVYLASTTPAAPLMSFNNKLEAVLAPTPNVVAEMVAQISAARREILLQIYEWDSRDEAAQTVFRALEERVARALNGNEEPSSCASW